jgi:hypothetical protein
MNRAKVAVSLYPSRLLLLCFLGVLFVVIPFAISPLKDGMAAATTASKTAAVTSTTKEEAAATPKKSPASKPSPPDLTKYESCHLSTPLPRGEWTTKPLWFPSYPSAIDDNIIKALVSRMTGLAAGAKSFYASSKKMGLRQCFGKTETAACMLVHPMIEMKPGPEGKTTVFSPPLIFVMRNPVTVFPAFLNNKRIKYAKLPGQQPINEWRKLRDDALPGSLWDGYKAQYLKWLSYTNEHYTEGMFLAYEHLMDEKRGPKIIEQLASILSEAGFPTVPKEEMSCLWYQTIGKEGLEHYYKYFYEFDDYLPSITEPQQAYLVKELSTWIEESKEKSAVLSSLLTEYRDTIQKDITLDIPWVNETKAPV